MDVFRRVAIILVFCFWFSGVRGAGAQTVQGTVRLAGPYPEPKVFEPSVHGKEDPNLPHSLVSQNLMVSREGYVQNAVLSLNGEFGGAASNLSELPVLDQINYQFEPHVLLVPKHGDFKVANSDPVAHDVRVFDEWKMLRRFEMDAGDLPVAQPLEKAGVYVIRCGLHKWMHAFVIHMEHPYYAVTDAEGAFALRDVPEGTYELSIWHETLGSARATLEVNQPVVEFHHVFQ